MRLATSRAHCLAGLALGCVAAICCLEIGSLGAQPPAESSGPKLGLNVNLPAALPGYTLIAPLRSTKTYLIDLEGRIVREWNSQYTAGQEAYLLENGHLLRAAHMAPDEAFFAGASQGGRIQEFTWDGELVWDFKFHDEQRLRHHAITRMPNGNIMMIVWERKTAQECIDAGVDPKSAGDGEILVDSLFEVKPNGPTGGDIVWEWHIWDHLIQDHDQSKANYGDVTAHPELIDANFARRDGGFFGNFARGGRRRDRDNPRSRDDGDQPNPQEANDAVRRLQGLGYVGTAPDRGRGPAMPISDWTHVNGVSYNAQLDQVMISPREFNEVWIIDHSTTTAEAKGHTGGRSGKGGDLLYRWGNPQTYRAGGPENQQLFSQHDTHWIPEGLPGVGHLLVFNNGGRRPEGDYSSVDEIILPVNADGTYEKNPHEPYGPSAPHWSFTAKNPADFSAPLMSGAQRLPNGNTLICGGFSGEIFEVTPEKQIVWRYFVPADETEAGSPFGPPGAGRGPGPNFGPPGPGRRGGRPGGFGGFGGGVPGSAAVFRAYRYGVAYAGLEGKDLTPGKPFVDAAGERDGNVGSRTEQ